MADYKIDGLEALINKVSKKAGNLAKLEQNVERATEYCKDEAKLMCPVDTGRLVNSLDSEVFWEGGSIVGSVFTNVEYAPYVEFGTSKMMAQPFLYPALMDNRKIIRDLIFIGITWGDDND